jgi:hypothetical protein
MCSGEEPTHFWSVLVNLADAVKTFSKAHSPATANVYAKSSGVLDQ